MKVAEVVLDASAVVRGLTTDGQAADLLDEIVAGTKAGHAPDLLLAEVSNALAVAVRTERRSLPDAQAMLDVLTATPIQVHPTPGLARAALELAASTELSAYDAFYAVLAYALEARLVTADRRLAAFVPGAVLVG